MPNSTNSRTVVCCPFLESMREGLREVLVEERGQLVQELRDVIRCELAARGGDTRLPNRSSTLYSVEQVAEMLHRPKKTIRAWIHCGALRAVKIGRPGRERFHSIRPQDLEAFIAREPPTERPIPSVEEQAAEILRKMSARYRGGNADLTDRNGRPRP
jgi:excisionase family DNA binding protein